MGKRTRIINDASDLVPLLLAFGSEKHKKVFDSLQDDWKTEKELKEITSYEVAESLDILKKSGLVESKWRMPEPGKVPEKEYHSSYSKIQINFQCSMEDVSDLVSITFKSDDELKNIIQALEKEVLNGNQSMVGLSRALEKSIMYIRSLARRSKILTVKGQRIERLTGEVG